MGDAVNASNEPTLPVTGRLAGIDYGTVRVGIAISNAGQSIASPFDTLVRRSPAQDSAYFKKLVADEEIVGFVVGLPVHLDGGESQKSCEARAFARWLGMVTGRPVVLVDERFTTHEAEQRLREAGLRASQRKPQRDKLAAQILLEGFLAGASRGGSDVRGLED